MRPTLNKEINPDIFANFYWLKEELIHFCKQNSIPSNGSKDELTERIYTYLTTGVIKESSKKTSIKMPVYNAPLSLDAKIPKGYKNDEQHRAFFVLIIGDHFKFNVTFMNWMKENSGQTYRTAVDEWNKIFNEKKGGKKIDISSQFQYNQYTRDFFKANPNAKREDAIKCWKYKKSLPGHNKYETEDLEALKKE